MAELREEAMWIYDAMVKLFEKWGMGSIPGMPTTQITSILQFIYLDHFDIPFILRYRKDYIEPLTVNMVYDIIDFDEKYCHFYTRKESLIAYLETLGTLSLSLSLSLSPSLSLSLSLSLSFFLFPDDNFSI